MLAYVFKVNKENLAHKVNIAKISTGTWMYAINWTSPLKYKPRVVCIELNPFKQKSGSVREFTLSSNREQSQVVKL